MEADDWQRLEQILGRALELPPDQRRDFISRTCAAEPDLEQQVLELLAADRRPDRHLETAGLDAAKPRGGRAGVGLRIGPYTLLRKLGEGGMSVVYLAARADEGFQRRVAVKLIRHDLDPRSRERFGTERKILARLQHPNIARLYDGGATAEGEPYLVMELVAGTRIDRYCRDRKLGLRSRLELFSQVCDAVHYAHQRLVVHRDIKPANILIGEDRRPKLLDFGISSLLFSAPSAGTSPTSLASADPHTATQGLPRLLTPAYASPEQLRGEPVTTASDIYSLGLVLYELLTGLLPWQLPGGQADWRTGLLPASEPPPPSVALAEPYPNDPTGLPGGPERLRRRLSGDLDSIALQALRGAPEQRYSSAQKLAEDVRRHLAHLPVEARGGNRRYRAGKFVRRHRWAVLAVAVLAVLTVATLTGFALQAEQIARERDRARIERDRAHQVTAFMVDLFAITEEAGSSLPARELLARGEERLRELELEEGYRASLLHTLGSGFVNLGLFDRAQPLFEEALRIRRNAGGSGSAAAAESLSALGNLLTHQGDFERAESLLREAVALERRDSGGDSLELAESLGLLGWPLTAQGRYQEAEASFREALAIKRRLLEQPHPEVASALIRLSRFLFERRNLEEAEVAAREAVVIRRGLGEEDAELAMALKSLAVAVLGQDGLAEAELLLSEALAIERRIYGAAHPEVAFTLEQQAMLRQLQGESVAAETLCREVLAMRRGLLGDDHVMVGWTLKGLGWVLEERGDLDGAEAVYRQSADIIGRGVPESSAYRAVPLERLGLLLLKKGDPRGAEPLLRDALEIRRRTLPPTNPLVLAAQNGLAKGLIARGELEEAEKLLLASYRAHGAQTGEARDLSGQTLRLLVDLYMAWDRPERADEYRRFAEDAMASTAAPPP